MARSFDVVIIGGAVIGSSAAYFLTKDAGFDGTVAVIEKDKSYQKCATTLSAASIRHQFSTPENIQISQFGIEFLRNAPALLGDDIDLSLHEGGYLLLASAGNAEILAGNHRVQQQMGAEITWLDQAAIAKRFPWLNVDDIEAGCIGERGEGWFDSYGLLRGLRRKARDQGATYIDDEVLDLRRDGDKITGVVLKSGEVISCGQVINAAGCQGATIAAKAGLSLPVESRKRFVFVFDCQNGAAITNCPLVVDPTGLYFRPEGKYFITGISPEEDNDPECFDYDVDYTLFDDVIWPTLYERVPAFEAIKMVNAWAGHYDYNVLDQNVVLGPHPEVKNFMFANGFSGHGLQQAPAIGRALSELIQFGAYQSLDLSIFNYQRVIDRRPIKEINVI